MIMAHGDDSGLIIPPHLAPHQVVIVPIFYGQEETEVLKKAKELEENLTKAGLRVKLDDRNEYTPGWKFSEWELRGVPLRLEIGPQDLKASQAVLVRRDNRQKVKVSWEGLPEVTKELLEEIQRSLFLKGKEFRDQNTRSTDNFAQFKRLIEENRGFIVSPWCGKEGCENKVKGSGISQKG